MDPIRVLVVTPYYAPDYGPSAPIYTALCEDLQAAGCEVSVSTAFPHYSASGCAAPDAGRRPTRRLLAVETLNGVTVSRSYVYRVPRSSTWRRLLYHASFNLSATLAALRMAKPDVILADAPVLWSGLPLLALALLPRVPFVYTVHDIYPDVLVKLGVVTDRRIVDLVDRAERFVYARSARITVLTAGFKQNLVAKGVAAEKIVVIPACVDVDFIRPLPRHGALRRELGLEDKFVALYAGNMGFSQGLDAILDAARMLAGEPRIVFALVGEGPARAALQASASAQGLRNVVFSSFLPRERVPQLYATADVGLVALKPEIGVESVPSKAYTIMASGRALIAAVGPDTEVGRHVDDTGCGLCVPHGDAAALAGAVLRLEREESLRLAMGDRGRAHVVAHYGREVASRRYLEIIRECAGAAARRS